MREIKFRAWEPAERFMLKPVRDLNLEDAGYTLTQFTGLKDADGREIYEGDIVRYRDLENKQRADKVVWSKFYTTYILGATFMCRVMDEIRVIGNIYENPELLK
jgi:hypothetical protein